MSSRRFAIEVTAAVALLALLGLSLARARERSIRAAYSLTFATPTGPETECAVDLTLDALGRDSLVLGGVADRAAFALSDVIVTDRDGRSVPIRQTDRAVRASGDKQILQHRLALRMPASGRVHVRYRARLGVRQGDEHVGYNGKCFGLVLPDAVVSSGRSLFLIPETGPSPVQVTVRMAVPRGWEVLTPWKRHGDSYRPGIRRGDELEHLIASTVGVGLFRITRLKERGTEFEFAVPASVPVTTARPVVEKLMGATRYITTVFRRGLGPRYQTFVLPKSMRLDEVPGEGWATGQGKTLIPLTSNRLRDFAEQLVDGYVFHAPYRGTLTDRRDYWFPTGLRRYYATRALIAGGFLVEDELAPSLAIRLATAAGSESSPLRLERDFDVPGRDVPGGPQAGAAILYDMDRAVRRATNGSRTLDDVMAASFRAGPARSPWAVLPQVAAGNDWAKYRETYLQQARDIPLATFPGLTRLAGTPTPAQPESGAHRLRLILTGTTGSFLEICGCKANQSGGAARRGTMLRRLRSAGPSLYLDTGNSFPTPGEFRPEDPFAVGEAKLALSILKKQGVAAMAVSTYELTWGARFFRELESASGAPFVSSIAERTGEPLAPEIQTAIVDGTRIAILSAFEPPLYLDAQGKYEDHAAEFKLPDAMAALKATLAQARPSADLVIVMGRLTPAYARRLAGTFPEIDVILSNECFAPVTEMQPDGKPRFFDMDPPGFAGRTLIAYTSRQQYGITTVDLDLTTDRRVARATFDAHQLDATVPDDPSVRAQLTRFYEEVGRASGQTALVEAPLAGDALRWNGQYAGAEACASCHSDEFDQWNRTPHANAYKTLLEAHRNYQPRCVTCHVVAYGAPHGYRFGDPSPRLASVQCEVCHGPGAAHTRAPEVAAMQRGDQREVCLSCHTPDHSESFVFEERLPHVVHDGPQSRPRPALSREGRVAGR